MLRALAASSEVFLGRVTKMLPRRQAKQLRRMLRNLGPTRLADLHQAQHELLRLREQSSVAHKRSGVIAWQRSSNLKPCSRASGTAFRHVAYDLTDMAAEADGYLGGVRREAPKIVEQARREAAAIRQQAEAAGRRAAEEAIERILDEKVAKQMKTLTPALQAAVAQIRRGQAGLAAALGTRRQSTWRRRSPRGWCAASCRGGPRSRRSGFARRWSWPPAAAKSRSICNPADRASARAASRATGRGDASHGDACDWRRTIRSRPAAAA